MTPQQLYVLFESQESTRLTAEQFKSNARQQGESGVGAIQRRGRARPGDRCIRLPVRQRAAVASRTPGHLFERSTRVPEARWQHAAEAGSPPEATASPTGRQPLPAVRQESHAAAAEDKGRADGRTDKVSFDPRPSTIHPHRPELHSRASRRSRVLAFRLDVSHLQGRQHLPRGMSQLFHTSHGRPQPRLHRILPLPGRRRPRAMAQRPPRRHAIRRCRSGTGLDVHAVRKGPLGTQLLEEAEKARSTPVVEKGVGSQQIRHLEGIPSERGHVRMASPDVRHRSRRLRLGRRVSGPSGSRAHPVRACRVSDQRHERAMPMAPSKPMTQTTAICHRTMTTRPTSSRLAATMDYAERRGRRILRSFPHARHIRAHS